MSTFWIQTYTGKVFDLAEPKEEMVDIVDIAHALSQMCRFTGHSDKPYSVSEHCCHCRDIAAEPFRLEALLHDAPEAYYGDLNRPMKRLLGVNAKAHMDNIDRVVRSALGLLPLLPPEVREIDNRLLMTEKVCLLKNTIKWPDIAEPYPAGFAIIKCWSPHRAECEFLARIESS